jgi:hypothetical protein
MVCLIFYALDAEWSGSALIDWYLAFGCFFGVFRRGLVRFEIKRNNKIYIQGLEVLNSSGCFLFPCMIWLSNCGIIAG